jgi:hypothetical protein
MFWNETCFVLLNFLKEITACGASRHGTNLGLVVFTALPFTGFGRDLPDVQTFALSRLSFGRAPLSD